MKINLITVGIFIALSSFSVFGQRTEAERVQQEREQFAQQRRINERQARMDEQASEQKKSLEDWVVDSINKERANKSFGTKSLSKTEWKKIKAELAPSPEDFGHHQSFLKQSNTGMFRLMPDLNCSQRYTVNANENCLKSMYLGEFYSYRVKDYVSKDFYDIAFKDGYLMSKGFLAQGILTTIGNVPLEDVSMTHYGLKFLADFQPATEAKKVREQFREIDAGVKFNGYQYSKSIQAIPETTYVMRVIAYRSKINRRSQNLVDEQISRGLEITPKKGQEIGRDDLKFLATTDYGNDKRIDLTVAFRIVRVDADGSLIILWKQLDKRKAPQIIYPKNQIQKGIEK